MFLSKTLDLTDLFTWLTPATDTGHSVLRLVACRVFRACWHHWRPRRWCWNMLLMMMLGRNVKVAWIITKKKEWEKVALYALMIFCWIGWLISSPVLNQWVSDTRVVTSTAAMVREIGLNNTCHLYQTPLSCVPPPGCWPTSCAGIAEKTSREEINERVQTFSYHLCVASPRASHSWGEKQMS